MNLLPRDFHDPTFGWRALSAVRCTRRTKERRATIPARAGAELGRAALTPSLTMLDSGARFDTPALKLPER